MASGDAPDGGEERLVRIRPPVRQMIGERCTVQRLADIAAPDERVHGRRQHQTRGRMRVEERISTEGIAHGRQRPGAAVPGQKGEDALQMAQPVRAPDLPRAKQERRVPQSRLARSALPFQLLSVVEDAVKQDTPRECGCRSCMDALRGGAGHLDRLRGHGPERDRSTAVNQRVVGEQSNPIEQRGVSSGFWGWERHVKLALLIELTGRISVSQGRGAGTRRFEHKLLLGGYRRVAAGDRLQASGLWASGVGLQASGRPAERHGGNDLRV